MEAFDHAVIARRADLWLARTAATREYDSSDGIQVTTKTVPQLEVANLSLLGHVCFVPGTQPPRHGALAPVLARNLVGRLGRILSVREDICVRSIGRYLGAARFGERALWKCPALNVIRMFHVALVFVLRRLRS